MRHIVDVPSLAVHSLSTTVVNSGCNTEEMQLPVGQRFMVELRGGFQPLEALPCWRFNVWAVFTRCRVGGNQPSEVTFEELYAGVVADVDLPQDARPDVQWGEVFDITRSTLLEGREFHREQPRIIPGFPLEWWQLVKAQVTAQTLGWFLDNRGDLPN